MVQGSRVPGPPSPGNGMGVQGSRPPPGNGMGCMFAAKARHWFSCKVTPKSVPALR